MEEWQKLMYLNLLTVKQAAKKQSCAESKIKLAIKEGRLGTVECLGGMKIPRKELDRFNSENLIREPRI